MLQRVSFFGTSFLLTSFLTLQAMDGMNEVAVARQLVQPVMRLQATESVPNLRAYIEGEREKQEVAERKAQQRQLSLNRKFHDAAGLGTGEKSLGYYGEHRIREQFIEARKLLTCGAEINWGYPLAHLLVAFKLREESYHYWTTETRFGFISEQVAHYRTRTAQNPSVYGEGHAFFAWLVDNGADVNKPWSLDDVDRFTHYDSDYRQECTSNVKDKATGIVPLAYALALCHEGCCVKKLLDAGALPYRGALYDAFHSKCPSTVLLLLEKNASIDEVDSHGDSAAHWALALKKPNERLTALQALQKRGASFAMQNNARCTPLHKAIYGEYSYEDGREDWRDCLKSDTSSLAFLLEHDAALNVQDTKGATALYDAVDKESLFFAEKRRVASRSDYHRGIVSDEMARKCLWKENKVHELYAQNNKMVEMLLKAGADCALAQNDGLTPLHRAAKRGMTECVRLLVASGAPVNAQDKELLTSLHHAAVAKIPAGEKAQIIKYLTEAGANMEAVDKEGNTPLIRTALVGDEDGVELLLGFGAKADARNFKTFTAVEAVKKLPHYGENYKNLKKLLEEYAQGKRKPHSRNGKPFVEVAEGADGLRQATSSVVLGNKVSFDAQVKTAELQSL